MYPGELLIIREEFILRLRTVINNFPLINVVGEFLLIMVESNMKLLRSST